MPHHQYIHLISFRNHHFDDHVPTFIIDRQISEDDYKQTIHHLTEIWYKRYDIPSLALFYFGVFIFVTWFLGVVLTSAALIILSLNWSTDPKPPLYVSISQVVWIVGGLPVIAIFPILIMLQTQYLLKKLLDEANNYLETENLRKYTARGVQFSIRKGRNLTTEPDVPEEGIVFIEIVTIDEAMESALRTATSSRASKYTKKKKKARSKLSVTNSIPTKTTRPKKNWQNANELVMSLNSPDPSSSIEDGNESVSIQMDSSIPQSSHGSINANKSLFDQSPVGKIILDDDDEDSFVSVSSQSVQNKSAVPYQNAYQRV